MPRRSHNLAVHGGTLALWLFADDGKRLMKRLPREHPCCTSTEWDRRERSWRVMTIGPQFVEELSRALSLRRVSDGMAMLDKAEGAWIKLAPNQPNATELLLLIAQWVDVGYRDYHLLDCLLLKFPIESRRRLPLEDYLRLRMVEGFRALSAEEMDTAIEILDFVLRAESGTADGPSPDSSSLLERAGAQKKRRVRTGVQRNCMRPGASAEIS